MENKTVLRENFLRSIKFDEEYLKKLDTFLKSNFSKVYYNLKTNKHSLWKEIDLDSLLNFIKKIDDERIEYIEAYAYKKENDNFGHGGEDLYIDFRKRNMFPNIEYKYKDSHKNSDIGFLEKLNKFFKTSRYGYAFLFDDDIIPFYWKFGFVQLVIIGLSIYLGLLFLIISFQN